MSRRSDDENESFSFPHFNQVHQGRKWEKDEAFSREKSATNFFFHYIKLAQNANNNKTCHFSSIVDIEMRLFWSVSIVQKCKADH